MYFDDNENYLISRGQSFYNNNNKRKMNMADTVIVIRGTLDWAKITGKARPYKGNPKYDKGPEWTVDITPNAESRAMIKKLGLSKKLREPGENDSRKETFISLKVYENRADGDKNDPPRIKDATGQAWDKGLIGNGSIADIKVKVVDYGDTKGMYLQAVRILEHVPYESQDFAPLTEDDEFFASDAEAQTGSRSKTPEVDEDLDDVPF